MTSCTVNVLADGVAGFKDYFRPGDSPRRHREPSAAVCRNQILFEQEETEVAEKANGFWQTIVSVFSVDFCAPNFAHRAKI
jgi:hypothetical protein